MGKNDTGWDGLSMKTDRIIESNYALFEGRQDIKAIPNIASIRNILKLLKSKKINISASSLQNYSFEYVLINGKTYFRYINTTLQKTLEVMNIQRKGRFDMEDETNQATEAYDPYQYFTLDEEEFKQYFLPEN